jgi:hypothetical protein
MQAERSEYAPKGWSVQSLLVAGGWALFLWSWIRVVAETPATTIAWSLEVVIVILAAVVIATLSWIWHNRRIHRVKGPRRAVPPAALVYERDFLARDVEAQWAQLRRAGVVTVAVEGDAKVFLAAAVPSLAE